MKVAPFRALTQSSVFCRVGTANAVEMKVAPFRALTHLIAFTSFIFIVIVEMKVAPFRALTQLSLRNILLDYFSRRNEGRPIQGIDTHIYLFPALS